MFVVQGLWVSGRAWSIIQGFLLWTLLALGGFKFLGLAALISRKGSWLRSQNDSGSNGFRV